MEKEEIEKQVKEEVSKEYNWFEWNEQAELIFNLTYNKVLKETKK